MTKLTKKQKALQGKVDSTKLYAFSEALGHGQGSRHRQVR